MVDFPNVPFADGQAFTPELAYEAFYSPKFTGQTHLLGHRAKLLNSELDPNGILLDVNTLQNGLKCSISNGLVVAYTAGVFLTATGTLQTVAAGQVVVPDNKTSFIYLTATGTIVASPQRDVLRVTLAQVVASGGSITSLTDYRHPATLRIQPPAYVLRSFGGQSTTPKVCTQGETLRGVIECSTFTVPAGISVTVDKYCKVVASGDVTIYGTVTVSQQAPGAPTTQYGLLTVGGYMGYLAGQGLGNNGDPYNYSQQAYGSGGGIGYIYNRPGNATNSWGYLIKGGDGGGTFWVEAAGNITVYSSATIAAIGSNGATPGSLDGTTTYQCLATGSGGGSGGCIGLVSAGLVTVQAGATIDVRGGNGGNGYIHTPGYPSALYAAGGRGGSGGYLVTIGQQGVNTSGFTFLNAGGAMGSWVGIGTTPFTIVNATTYTIPVANFGVGAGGIGAGFAGQGGRTSDGGTAGGVSTVLHTPASAGIQFISTNLPS